LTVPAYLKQMPSRVLFGKAAGIEQWCADNQVMRPTLLDLANARAARTKGKQ
jgi:hypothetical protein